MVDKDIINPIIVENISSLSNKCHTVVDVVDGSDLNKWVVACMTHAQPKVLRHLKIKPFL